MFDCHVHSDFSGDCDTPAELSCNSALTLGLEGLAFTDHLDIDYPCFDISFNIDFDKYNTFMDSLKLQYQDQIKILKGIEVGIQPHVIEATKKIVKKYDFDFVIGSTHIIDRLDPYNGHYFLGKTQRQAYMRYLEEILYMVNKFEDFDVVGHIGYVRRYGDFQDRSMPYKDYSDVLDAILSRIIHKGKGIEVNTSGFRNDFGAPIPTFDIIKRYKELGGEIICIGSDAHHAEHVGSHLSEASELLKEAGFKYTTYFEKRKPNFITL